MARFPVEVAYASFCGVGFRSPDVHDSMQRGGGLGWQLDIAKWRDDGAFAIAQRRDDGALTVSHTLTPIRPVRPCRRYLAVTPACDAAQCRAVSRTRTNSKEL